MFDFIIKRELNKLIIDVERKKLSKLDAIPKLDEMMKKTKLAPKGCKRQLKNNIFQTKKKWKL